MSNTPAINRKALDLLHIYTGHTFRVSRLAGDGMKEQRRQIMSALMGQRMPVSKSGITAIARHFYLMAGPALDGYTCEVDREDKFAVWAKGVISGGAANEPLTVPVVLPINLEPCPHCDGLVRFLAGEPPACLIECPACEYAFIGRPGITREQLAQKWNRRANSLKCEACNGTGYYGDNGPGIKGNAEYQACDKCEAGRGK